MKRRTAIKQIGLGVSAGLVLPTWLSSCKDEDTKPRFNYTEVVAIIGAGAAGLYAADILAAKGVDVRLLEASDKIGGRVKSLHSFDKPTEALLFNPNHALSSNFPTDLGADKLYGSDSIFAKIVSLQNVPFVDISTLMSNKYFIDDLLSNETAMLSDADFVQAKNFLDSLASASGNGSVSEAIQSAGISPRMVNILESWIGNKYGSSNTRISISDLAQAYSLRGRNNNELLPSTNPLQDVLGSRFSKVAQAALLNTAIKNIDYTGEKIVLSGEKKVAGSASEPYTLSVDKVILTVPLPVLQADIAFNPGLPASKLMALSHIGMDASVRVILDFKQNFWGSDTGYLYGGLKSPEYFNSGIGRTSAPNTLSVTINGPKAEELSPLGTDMINVLLQELDGVFDGKATQFVRKDLNDNIIAVIQDWSKEPFIKGGVSYIKPGGSINDRVELGRAIDNRLYFAGEATDVTGEWGTVNGALTSAERVAQRVLESLQA